LLQCITWFNETAPALNTSSTANFFGSSLSRSAFPNPFISEGVKRTANLTVYRGMKLTKDLA
jgi:hypothetical protein